MLTAGLEVPASFTDKTLGLVGTYNGNKNDDYTFRDGVTVLPADASESQAYDWGMSCKLQYCYWV